MAQVHALANSLSKRRWYAPRQHFVAGERFETRIAIKNDGPAPFPQNEMVLRFAWEYPTQQQNPIEVRLLAGQIKPGESYHHPPQRRLVLSSGVALLKLEYTPYDGRALVLYDESGQEIDFHGNLAFRTLQCVSVTELATLAGLSLATIAAAISGIGLILTVLLH